MSESPNTVHGRLLEAVHIAGYTFERACGELEYLLDEDRWRFVGDGFEDINAFLATLDFSDFKLAVEQRKKLAKRLAAIQASQRATGRLLGVNKETIRDDLGLRPPRNSGGNPPHVDELSAPSDEVADVSGGNPPAWFQSDADPTREAKRTTGNVAREADRAQLRRERIAAPTPSGLYRLIYADPPWQYEHVVTETRAIENQYPTMALDDICAMSVPAADDCVLFLWATSPKLEEALRVVAAWGFSYRTCAAWDKQVIGMGYYFRQQHELLLVAARGTLPVPPPATRPSSIIHAKRGRHSEKPDLVYDLLETMYPEFTEADRIELSSRSNRTGWTQWGNEPAVAS